MLKYIELKTGHGDSGPAWVARVKSSKSGRTIYFDGRALKRGSGISGNYFDSRTQEEFWVSGVKKDGNDRHWAGSGKVRIEQSAVAEYLSVVSASTLNVSRFSVCPDLPESDPAEFVAEENEPL